MQYPIHVLAADETPDVAQVGGKGFNLIRLAQAGLPVPHGFVIGTDAYVAVMRANDLGGALDRAIDSVVAADIASSEHAAETIRALFDAAVVPLTLREAISAAFAALGAPPVAVRSSATAEDLPGMSFAGQHDSYLNVRGEEEVLAAIKACWASLWNARAIAYRRQQHVPQGSTELAIAVVVQTFVNATQAGVVFTANPLNNRRDQIVINAAWGLGDAIVSGTVTPDHWIVDKHTGQIVERHVAHKSMQLVAHAQGTAAIAVPPALQQQASLSDDAIAAVVATAQHIDSLYGIPMDVEWAIDGGSVVVLQARPVTTLFPLPMPHDDVATRGLRVLMSMRTPQNISVPFTPMGHDVLRRLLSALFTRSVGDAGPTDRWYKVAAGRMFVDITETLRRPRPGREAGLLSNMLRSKGPVAERTLVAFVRRNRAALTSRPSTIRPTRRTVSLVTGLLGHLLRAVLWPAYTARTAPARTDRYLATLMQRERAASTLRERLHLIDEICAHAAWVLVVQTIYALPGVLAERRVTARLRRWFGSADALAPVLRALPHNPTTRMGAQLIEIACALQERHAVPCADDPELRAFLAEFGHRSTTELDVGVARWREAPDYLLSVLETSMAAEPHAIRQRLQNERAAAEQAVIELTDTVRRRKGRLWASMVGRDLHAIRALAGLRELPKADLIRAFAVCRQILQRIGSDLVARARIADGDDVFFLTRDEVLGTQPLHEAVHHRRAAYARDQAIMAIPYFMANTGECLYGNLDAAASDGLQGIGVAPGVYEGIARVVRDPRSAQLQPGEILVAYATDPTWTPLFLSAGALVMATGGPLSHGGIVAREYGVPGVAGIEAVTEKLQTGDRVRVDGTAGRVDVLTPHAGVARGS